MRAFPVTVYSLGAASPALTCRPMEGEIYDEFPSPDFTCANAEVTDLRVTKSDDTESCLSVSYTRTQMIAGETAERFRVETCGNEGPITEAEFVEIQKEYGFVQSATVLVRVIKLANQPDALRYAVPSCRGPVHIGLNGMTDDQRDAYVAEMKASVLEARRP